MPYQYPTPSPTATAALSYGPTYSAASPECLTSTQLPLLQPLLLFLTGLTYSAASPEFLNSDKTPPLTAIAALSYNQLTLLLLQQ